MKKSSSHNNKKSSRKAYAMLAAFLLLLTGSFFMFPKVFTANMKYDRNGQKAETAEGGKEGVTSTIKNIFQPAPVPKYPPLDKIAYDAKMLALANIPVPKVLPPVYKTTTDPKTGVVTKTEIPPKPLPVSMWPVKAPYPNDGALLPFNRIIAYYGNLYSKGMGVLGQYPEAEMLSRLDAEKKKWEAADPNTPVITALHYIAVTAQGSPGEAGMYRLRMPDSEIDKVLVIAEKSHSIVFLDIQVGLSTIQAELPRLEKYIKMPEVHIGIDPEFSMKTGAKPGKVVGTFDAVDINYVAEYMAKIVRDNNLPPKVLIVHRYTEKMVTNYKLIKPLPEVQILMHMDGWGGAAKKVNTYQLFVAKQPVQFTGFKLFYKNDILTPGTNIMTPTELLKLSPQPSYIQYQ